MGISILFEDKVFAYLVLEPERECFSQSSDYAIALPLISGCVKFKLEGPKEGGGHGR